MTSAVYTGFNPRLIKNHLSRILIATFAWFAFTSLFELIDSRTGSCSHSSMQTKLLCKTNRHEWLNSFDISGHTFLLMHSLFLMIEEVRIFNEWDVFHKKLTEKLSYHETGSESVSFKNGDKIQRAVYLYNLLTPFIRVNFVFMALLALLWEVMLLSTFLYYHTIMHKLLAAFAAIVYWFLTYKTWFANKSLFMSPGLPGDGSV